MNIINSLIEKLQLKINKNKSEEDDEAKTY